MVELEALPEAATIRDPQLLPLENGESLHASEFLRRYEVMPEVTKAELIQGIVHVMSPVSLDHGEPDNLLQTVIGVYALHTTGVKAATNATVKLSADDVFQPDGLLRSSPEYGGQSRSEVYLQGAPELGVEIAVSSSSIDANAKKTSYRRSGMQEYIVWRTQQKALDWWQLVDDDYRSIEPDENGILKSRIFPGLWLDPQALLSEDGVRVLEVVNQGLASPEHGEFVERVRGTQS